MNLTDDQLNSFIQCWQEDFGETLTQDQARVEATRLLEFYTQFKQMIEASPALKDQTSVTESKKDAMM